MGASDIGGSVGMGVGASVSTGGSVGAANGESVPLFSCAIVVDTNAIVDTANNNNLVMLDIGRCI